MATRSKNYKLTKIIAFILATVFTFTSGYYIYVFVKGTFFYNVYKTENFFQTNVFMHNYLGFRNRVLSVGEINSCENAEDYYKTSLGKRKLKEAKEIGKTVKDACDYLDKAKVKVSVTEGNKYRYTWNDNSGKTHYFSYNGDEIDNYDYNSLDYTEEYYIEENFQMDTYETTWLDYETTKPQQNNGDATINSIAGNLNHIWNMTGGLNYGEMSSEELVKAAVESTSGFNPGEHWDIGLKFIDNNDSLKFALFYNTTGKVYTNCGVKYNDSHEQVIKKLGGDYLEYKYDDKFYSSINYPEMAPGKFFTDIDNVIRYHNDLEHRKDYELERAYFSFTPTNDSLICAMKSYETFVQKHFSSEKYDNGQKLTHYGITAIVTFLLACACFIYLLFVAGKNAEENVKMNLLDRTPLAISTAVLGCIALCFVAVFVCVPLSEYEIFDQSTYGNFQNIPTSLFVYTTKFSLPIVVTSFTLCILTCFALLYSIVKKLRNKCLLKYTLCGACFRFVKKILKFFRKLAHKLVEKIKEIYIKDYEQGNGKKFYILSFLTIFTLSLINIVFIFLTAFADEAFLVLLIIINILVALYLALLVFCFDRIACGVTRIKLGSLDCNINTRFMPPYFRALAKEISGVRDGLQTAVNQAMKDQAMKTELITNVTHDIKTPLTSIITYVDLLKRAESEEERENYLNVLEEKSLKMKKLIEDLVQASKAASGAVEVNLAKLDLGLFASQAVGEYSDEFAENDIELVLKNPDNAVFVRADAKLTDRVIENLISNIKKYALKGTRAYVEVKENEGFGEIIFKNTSADPLEVDSEKLTERFYRADASRTGEGNGLGLSIARDYCIVQGGKLVIETDADLFKVKIVLPMFVD